MHPINFDRPLEGLGDVLRNCTVEGYEQLAERLASRLTPVEMICVGFAHKALSATEETVEGVSDAWGAVSPTLTATEREYAFWCWADAHVETALICGV